MGALRATLAQVRGRPLEGLAVSFCLQLTKETAALIGCVMDLGARVAACSGNPLTTQDDAAAHLAERGAAVRAWSGQTASEFRAGVRFALDARPDITVDDGAELCVLSHSRGALAARRILGGTEETTTGVRRVRALYRAGRLRYPVIAVNDALTKARFDNPHGTGQSAADALLRATSLLVAGRTVVVAGYGPVGRGVAARMAGLGARVCVTEVDPVRALEALCDGHAVSTMSRAARSGDVFVTCTGQTGVITASHMRSMKSGAVLCNAGHFDVEIDTEYLLRRCRVRRVRGSVDECTMPGARRVYLVSRGRVANLATAPGHPPEIMALSFAGQLRAILRIARDAHGMEPRVHGVRRADDEAVASAALRAAR